MSASGEQKRRAVSEFLVGSAHALPERRGVHIQRTVPAAGTYICVADDQHLSKV